MLTWSSEWSAVWIFYCISICMRKVYEQPYGRKVFFVFLSVFSTWCCLLKLFDLEVFQLFTLALRVANLHSTCFEQLELQNLTRFGGRGALREMVFFCTWGPLIHFYALAVFLGTTFWVTFIAGIIQWKNMKTKDFGTLQSHLFPAYFLVQIITCTTILLAYAAMNSLVVITQNFWRKKKLKGVRGSKRIKSAQWDFFLHLS